MLFRFLDYLRKKPSYVRQQYAFGGAVLFTAIVAGVWSLSLPTRFADISAGVEGGVEKIQPAGLPFSHIVSQIKTQFAGLASEKNENESASSTTLIIVPTSETNSSSVIKTSSSTIVIGSSTADTYSKPGRIIMIATSTPTTTRPTTTP